MITTRDQLIDAMANKSSKITIEKASMPSAVTGQFQSLWRATGQPGQGAIPTTPALPNHLTVGSLPFTQQTAPATSYIGIIQSQSVNVNTTLEIHDRLMHMGGLSGTVFNPNVQTVNLDLHANLASNNLDVRKGSADFSEVQWWMERYADTGSTGSNATINVTFNDGTSGNLAAIAAGGTLRAGRMLPLNSLIQAANAGKYIRSINTVTLSASTGTAGNFGFTCTRFRCSNYHPGNNARWTSNWMDLGLPEVPNQACLFPVLIAGTTNTGILRGTGKIIHG